MLNKIIAFSIHNKLIVGLFVAGLIGYGVYEVTQLPIDAVPDITNNQVQVITIAPSFGATDIERLVTFPIEMANSNIDGTKEIRSFSRFGLSLVTIVFDDNTDIHWARQQIAERLQKVQSEIPAGIGTPEMGPITTGLGEIYQYVVRPLPGYENKYDETELRTIQDWIIKRQLLGVEGVADVSSFGGKLKQFEVAVDPKELHAFGLSISDVMQALEKNNQNTGGTYIEKGPTALYIRTEGLLTSQEEIGNIAVKYNSDGSIVFMRDVAEITTGHAVRYGAMCYNDEGEVSGAVVMMLKGANSSKVIKNIKTRIEQIQKTLPEGVVIEAFLDRTKMVNNAIGTVEKNLLEGALIVIFILVIFLGNFRAGLLVASVIPLAMLFAIIMMNTFGVSGNLMSLGALDFGLIVDGAVIIVESVLHKLAHAKSKSLHHLNSKQMDAEVEKSASKMMNSAVFGQIIILIVYLPILTLQGIEGKMFKPMAQTVAFALIGAFILSVTYIPMMSALVLSKKLNHKPTWSDRAMARLEMIYEKYLMKVLKFPKTVITVIVIMFASAVLILTNMGGEFIPQLEEGDFAVDTRVLTGSSLNTTIEYTQKAAHVLKSQFPEVEMVVTKIGSGEVPTDPMPMEASDLMVILKDKKEWTSAKTFTELSDKMSKALEDVPGITTGFQYPVQMRFNELMTGARQDVVCKIFGENLDTLAKYSAKLGGLIQQISGTKDLYVEPVTGLPQVVIRYNRALMAQYGLSIEEVNKVVGAGFAGYAAGLVFEGEKRFDLVVRLKGEEKKSHENIRQLLIPTPSGIQIPLNQIATVEIEDGPNQIQREDAKRRIITGFNIQDRDVQTIVEELQIKEKEELDLPDGYYVTYGGAFENLNAAKTRLGIAVPISLALIFILLFFAFNSLKQGLLIYTAIPLSAIGGIYMLALRDMPFSISAGVGFIALFGVAVLNGIVLISEFNQLKKSGLNNLYRIVITGGKLRLRPVLMTAFVASLGFLPMALSHGSGAEVQRPLATVVIGGLLLATFLTLFVLPTLYVLFETKTASNNTAGTLSKIGITSILLAIGSTVNSQRTIDLQSAIDSALKNNKYIKQDELKSKYAEAMKKSGFDIPSTEVSAEFGQINSIYSDNRIGVSQLFSFPTIYTNQKKLLQQEWLSSDLNLDITKNEIRKSVRENFYLILSLREKEKLLQTADSIYSNFMDIQNLRFEKGESNIIEKSSAEMQRGRIAIQLQQVKQELDVLTTQFQILLNTSTFYEPESSALLSEYTLTQKTTLTASNPELKLLQLESEKAATGIQLEKSKRLPDIRLGYYSMTMLGNGADNVIYNSSSRFNSVQVGLAIPLLGGNQNARIKAALITKKITENYYSVRIDQLTKNLETLQNRLYLHFASHEYYTKTANPSADAIIDAAGKQLQNGEINYLDWFVLTNEAIAIKNEYIENVMRMNNTIININYLLNN